MHLGKPSTATLIASAALFVALGGSSYAAIRLPANSVGTKQLKKNSVSSAKVKPGSLLLSDFKSSERTLMRGSQGPRGDTGATGAQGPPGPAGAHGVARGYAFINDDATLAPGANNVISVHTESELLGFKYCVKFSFAPVAVVVAPATTQQIAILYVRQRDCASGAQDEWSITAMRADGGATFGAASFSLMAN